MAFNFPNSPTVGQVFEGYTWDGEKWMSSGSVVAGAGASGAADIIAIKVYTASGTYVPSTNMTSCIVECYGGGGGGGGALGVATNFGGAGGGGAGGYSRKTLTATQVGVSLAVTIGAGGNGGAAGNNVGIAGGDTSVSTVCIAKGGSGGAGSGGSHALGGLGGVAGTGDVTSNGAIGLSALGGGTTSVFGQSGNGASSPVGGGGRAALAASGAAAGNAATGYASGGSGAATNTSAGTAAGGRGSDGLCIVTEYGSNGLTSAEVVSVERGYFAVNRNGVNQTGGTAATANKIIFTNKVADNRNWFNTSTSRFQPTEAGFYFFSLNGLANSGASETCQANVYKNGTIALAGTFMAVVTNLASHAAGVLYLNGTTDYVEGFIYLPAAVTTIIGTTHTCHFEGWRVDGPEITPAPVVPGHLTGLTLTAAGATATFGVTAGLAADATNAVMMRLLSAYTKTASAWAVGDGNGSLDSGTIAASTWYHVFLIRRPDTGLVDICTTTSSAGPITGTNIPVAYTQFRRIGSMRTDGASQWIKFLQTGDEFLWDALVTDVNTAATPAAGAGFLPTLSVPLGVKVIALFNARDTLVTTGCALFFASPDVAVVVTGGQVGMLLSASATTASAGAFAIRTNISSQIRVTGNGTSATYSISTYGWIDRRGRDG